jgi:hypothetical protein
MLDRLKKCANRAKSVCAVALLVAGASAHAAQPLVQCRTKSFEGTSVCEVDMASYAQLAGNGVKACPTGVKSTGSALLCEQTFAAAADDAKLYFAAPGAPSQPYLISIGSGTYDFSSQIHTLPSKNGAIDLSGIAPASAGCLAGRPAETGLVTPSGNPCLIVSGAGPDQTTLVTADGINGIAGKSVSHIMVENMTLSQPNQSTTQGIYVSQASQSINGTDYPTLTLDIASGFPTPLELFQIDCKDNGLPSCTKKGLSTVVDGIYMRAYTNSASPELIQSTSLADSNKQYQWGYPSVDHIVHVAMPPKQPDPVNFPDRWTLTLSQPASERAIPSYYSGTTAGVANLICMKIDHANALWFDDDVSGGTDVIANNLVWTGAARSTFRGIKGLMSGGGLGAQVYNSSIERGAPVGGSIPCLSTQSGGIQIGHQYDPPTYGNAVYGLRAVGTGDDSLAVFNDIGGTPDGKGGYYPQTFIRHSSIGSSFARDILLVNARNRTHVVGNSPVNVDAFTQAEINDNGHCDPLVLGSGNCPVTYVSY